MTAESLVSNELLQVGPYDDDHCHFCKKSAKQGPQYVAGYERREKFATVGQFFSARQACAEKPYQIESEDTSVGF